MAGVGEVLGALGLLEPGFKACKEAYGFYKLTKNFGEDYQKAERGLRGQMARLKLLEDTRITDLLSVPDVETRLTETVLWTLQGMRNDFERCELLMKTHGEPKSEKGHPRPSISSDHSDPPQSAQEKKSKGHFSLRRTKSPTSPSSSATGSLSPSESHQSSATLALTVSSVFDPKVTRGIQDDVRQAKALQSSSGFLARLKWASEDRTQFFAAVHDLTKANDLLESLLRIKSLEDQAFLPKKVKMNRDTESFLTTTRATLGSLHQDLLRINPHGRDVEFSLKLALDESDKETYADYIDSTFDAKSSVYSLQAHSKTLHGNENKTFYLLAETSLAANSEVPNLKDLVSAFCEVDSTAEAQLQCVGDSSKDHTEGPELRIYQDTTFHWRRTKTLAQALDMQCYQDLSFQRHYSQLGLFIAFSYVVLPFMFRGGRYPQATHYTYYDQVFPEPDMDEDIQKPTTHVPQINVESSATDPDTDQDSPSFPANLEDDFQDLHSPYITFNFGSRPAGLTTKALGRRAGFTAPTNNPLVALGLLLHQIGSWKHISSSPCDITQMRRDALESFPDLIRLSGVEFADLTRACLNWKEVGPNGKRYSSEEMLMEVYARLEKYNLDLQGLA